MSPLLCGALSLRLVGPGQRGQKGYVPLVALARGGNMLQAGWLAWFFWPGRLGSIRERRPRGAVRGSSALARRPISAAQRKQRRLRAMPVADWRPSPTLRQLCSSALGCGSLGGIVSWTGHRSGAASTGF